jgi:hypothetical protein
MSKFDELQSSLDEIWLDMAELKSMLTAIDARLDRRDKHALVALKHIERLIEEKTMLQRVIGIQAVCQ